MQQTITTIPQPLTLPSYQRPWSVPVDDYNPPDVTLPELADWTGIDPDDPTGLDWPARQAAAIVPFDVDDGHPRHPGGRTGRCGRQLERWGENPAADPVVVATVDGTRWVLLIQRSDTRQWAIPGGMVEPGETPTEAAARELWEEAGVHVADLVPQIAARCLAGDPRDTDDAWIATTVALYRLDHRPEPLAGDDATAARWFRFDSVEHLDAEVREATGCGLYQPHPPLLQLCLAVLDDQDFATALDAAAPNDPVAVIIRLGRSPSLRRRVGAQLDAELRKTGLELGRVDAKAGMLLATAGVLLGGGLAVLANPSTHLPNGAALAAWVAVGIVAGAVERLAAACRPRLGGDFGFMHWANRPTVPTNDLDLLAELAATSPTERLRLRATELDTISRALRGKYQAVRTAVWLLLAGLGTAAAGAVLTVLT
jgi:ADP-ribose pyrophosphatase YjhB (NUDIX family)